MKLKYLLFAVSLLLMSVRANATFSIIAYDSSTNQFGAALASCARASSEFDVSSFVSVIVPEKGIFMTKAMVEFPNRNLEQAKQKIQSGNYSGDQIISWLKAYDQSSTPNTRQYLTLSPTQGFAYSGSKVLEPFGSIIGTNYVIAGNTIDSDVLSTMEQGFTNHTGDLKSKLLAALTSVERANIGDTRCTKFGISSMLAFVKVGSSTTFYNSQTNMEDAIKELTKLITTP